MLYATNASLIERVPFIIQSCADNLTVDFGRQAESRVPYEVSFGDP